MSPERQAEITAALARCPDGAATAIELAKVLNWKHTAASFNLGVLYFAKVVDRENVAENTRQYRYWLRPPIETAPPTQWSPPVRIAKHPNARVIAALAAAADALTEEEYLES